MNKVGFTLSIFFLGTFNFSFSQHQLCYYDAIGTGPLQYSGGISGSGIYGIVALDFNHDGILDIATTNSTAHNVSILFGNLNGIFDPPVNYTGTGTQSEILVADLNHDSITDLITTDQSGGLLNVFMGMGNGVFGIPNNYGIGGGAFYAVTGDFNEDGHMDVVTANSNSGTISVLLNTGFGTFGFVQLYPAGGADCITKGDFNHDGHLDLATCLFFGQVISLMYGTGNGTFSSPVQVSTNYRPLTISAADMNDDGNSDLVCTNYLDYVISVHYMDSSGAIVSETDFPTGWYEPSFTVVKDINNDSYDDLVFAVYNSNGIGYMLNDGFNQFVNPDYYGCMVNPVDFVVEDFNNDGLQDVVIGSSYDPYFTCMLQCPSTGLDNHSTSENEFTIRTFSSHFQINFSKNISDSRDLFLYDELGNLVSRIFILENQAVIPRQDLARGVYFFRYPADNGLKSGKLVAF